jgi:Family of unknown function (DUF5947)
MTPLRALQRFARAAPGPPPPAIERCEICHEVVGEHHGHLVDLERRTLCCACRPCALLFENPEAARGRYRAVPDRVRVDPSFALSDEAWARLQIPVRLAFLFHDSSRGRFVAGYPSVAGATQAELPPERCTELAATALVRALVPDVEALLLLGEPGTAAPRESFLVPVDLCYRLVALVRRHWRGFSGGSEVWREVDEFFADLRRRARPLAPSDGPGAGR